MRALLSAAEPLGMSLWVAASAVSPQLATRWQLSPAETGWLTAIVQLGFVAGTALAALFNAADVVPSRMITRHVLDPSKPNPAFGIVGPKFARRAGERIGLIIYPEPQ